MRKHYLDNIRWVTVVIVVIYHVFYMYNAEGVLGGLGKITNLDVQYYDIFMYLVYPWIMPVLFIVSGISARLYLDHHTSREFIKSKTVRLLVPSTIGLFVFQFLQGYISMTLGTAFQDLGGANIPKPVQYLIMVASGSGVLWYMHLLWLYCMILVPIRKIEKGRLLQAGAETPLWLIALFYFLIWGSAQVLNAPIIAVYRLAFYFAFFILGYFVFSNDEVIEKLKKTAIPLILLALALNIAFAILYFGQNYADKPINRNPLFSLCAYFTSLAILAGFARFADFSNAFTAWMTGHSLGLYVFHYLGISAVARFLAKNGLLPAPASYILSLAAGFVFGYGLYEIISRIPFFRWAVLGITGTRGGSAATLQAAQDTVAPHE